MEGVNFNNFYCTKLKMSTFVGITSTITQPLAKKFCQDLAMICCQDLDKILMQETCLILHPRLCMIFPRLILHDLVR